MNLEYMSKSMQIVLAILIVVGLCVLCFAMYQLGQK